MGQKWQRWRRVDNAKIGRVERHYCLGLAGTYEAEFWGRVLRELAAHDSDLTFVVGQLQAALEKMTRAFTLYGLEAGFSKENLKGLAEAGKDAFYREPGRMERLKGLVGMSERVKDAIAKVREDQRLIDMGAEKN